MINYWEIFKIRIYSELETKVKQTSKIEKKNEKKGNPASKM